MPKARKTFTSIEPVKSEPLDVQDQIAAFFAKGGRVQRVAEGVTAETLRDRRGMKELSAKQALGGKKGGSSKHSRKKREPIEFSEFGDD